MEGLIGMAGGGDDFQDGDPLPSYTHLERAYSQDINYGGFSTPSSFDPKSNGPIFSSAGNGPLLPDPLHMRAAFHEWLNAIYLQDKEKEEKELRNQVIAEADEFKRAFTDKRKKNIKNNTALNIEREKVILTACCLIFSISHTKNNNSFLLYNLSSIAACLWQIAIYS
ncbi:putative clathrin light chain [Helianthus debilis subsp. tardiflorus]